MTSPRGVRLLHTIVAMGVALTGGTVATACGGIADGGPIPGDAGLDGDGQDGAYAHIGIGNPHEPDGGVDVYATIRPDGYPTIGIDTGADAYAHIGIAIDAGAPDGYPIIP
jgi:hypothetical protein